MFLLNKVRKVGRMFFPGRQAKRVKKWFAADGDMTHRLNYPELNENSLVIDLGGYKGQWTSDIYSKYKCRVFVFEPVKKYYAFTRGRFSRNDSIEVYNNALSDKNGAEFIYLNADGSSTIRKEGVTEKMIFRKFDEMMKELAIESIDLMKVNIEGGEYDLLDHIVFTGWVNKIQNIQVQFHNFFPEAGKRMNKIQTALSSTHETTFQFEFVWENWKKK